jgi:hypothetical protein
LTPLLVASIKNQKDVPALKAKGMIMFKDLLKRPGSGFLLGIGVVILAPVVLPVLARAARPLAKAVLHGYFALVDELKSLAAEEETKATPMLTSLATAGVEEAATTAGEAAVEDGVADVLVESVVTVLEVV